MGSGKRGNLSGKKLKVFIRTMLGVLTSLRGVLGHSEGVTHVQKYEAILFFKKKKW